jgi:hypothetical protein
MTSGDTSGRRVLADAYDTAEHISQVIVRSDRAESCMSAAGQRGGCAFVPCSERGKAQIPTDIWRAGRASRVSANSVFLRAD